jgi:hypothetical protein
MMFLLLPFFALMLKLIYIRSRRYYIEHLVFTLHIHSFVFFLLLILLLIMNMYENGTVVAVCLGLLFLYLLLSFRRVYRQGWFKTLTKMCILLIFYSIAISLFMIGTILISFLLF